MHFNDLLPSVFTVFRTENGITQMVGTAFIINSDPLFMMTCNHVIGEATQNNDGAIQYSIGKSIDAYDALDLRNVNFSILRIAEVRQNPDLDVAILRVNPAENGQIAQGLGLPGAPPLPLSFNINDRSPGAQIEWVSAGGSGHLPLVPRFFRGHLISRYRTDHNYSYRNQMAHEVNVTMHGIYLLEVDQLFIPGVSGSAIIERESSRVIGYVHGFQSWGIQTNSEFNQEIQLTEGQNSRHAILKYKLPLVTSLSVAVDLRSAETWLRHNNFIP